MHYAWIRSSARAALLCAFWLSIGTVQAVAATAIENDNDADTTSAHSTIVLQNATIHPLGGSEPFTGSIVIVDDKISEMGESIQVPAGAKTIDLTGFQITPGLIESRGKLWLTPAGITEANRKAELDVVDAIDPWSEDWRELAAQGITAVYVQPSASSSLGGYGAVLRVGPHATPADIVLKKQVAIQAAIGITAASSKDRAAQILALDKLLESAKEKKKKAETKEKKTAEKVKTEATKEKKENEKAEETEKKEEKKSETQKPEEKKEKLDATKKALRRILKKEIPLHVEVHHSDAVRKLIALAKKHDIRIVFDGLSQVKSCSRELIESGFPIVVGPLFEPGASPKYRHNANFDWLPAAVEAQQPWSISTFSNTTRASRLLRVQSAMAVRVGVSRENALAAITTQAARMLGISDLVGSLEVGKQADIAVFAGDPLDPASPTRLVMSRGKITFESNAKPPTNNTKPPSNNAEPTSNNDVAADSLPQQLPDHYAIKSARILVDGIFTEGAIVVENGLIASIGKQPDTAGLKVFDLANAVVTPGLVNASSSLGQSAIINDAVESDSSHLRAVDAVDPATQPAKKMLNGGFIHVGVSPGAINTSGGMMGHLRLGAADYVANPDIANVFALASSARKNDRFPASLNGQIQLLNSLFEGTPSPSSVYVASAVGRSIANEKIASIQSVAKGDRRALFVANSNLEIRSALSFTEKFKIRTTLLTNGRIGDFAQTLADRHVGTIVAPFSGNEYDTQIHQWVATQLAGAPLAFSGEKPEAIRVTAALLVNAGVDPTAALLGLTEGGAKAIGMNDVGLAKGNPADFVVWNDSPLNLAAKPLAVVVDGKNKTTKRPSR